jgi:hypothetical protein
VRVTPHIISWGVRRCAPLGCLRRCRVAQLVYSQFENNFTCYRHVKPSKSGFAWREHRQQRSTSSGRIQTPRHACDVVYMGPSSPIPPALLYKLLDVKKRVAKHSKPIQLPPPYGGEQGRKGKGYPNPSKGYGAVPLRPYGGAAVSIGGAETITVQRLSVHGCDPTVLRSERLCRALERFHCGPYPPTPQPSFRTHRGPFKDEMRV